MLAKRLDPKTFRDILLSISLGTLIGRIGSLGLQDAIHRFAPRLKKTLVDSLSLRGLIIILISYCLYVIAWWYLGANTPSHNYLLFVLLTIGYLFLSGISKQEGNWKKFIIYNLCFYCPLIFIGLVPSSIFHIVSQNIIMIICTPVAFISIKHIAQIVESYVQKTKFITDLSLHTKYNKLAFGYARQAISIALYSSILELSGRVIAGLRLVPDEFSQYILVVNFWNTVLVYPSSIIILIVQYISFKVINGSSHEQIRELFKRSMLFILIYIMFVSIVMKITNFSLFKLYTHGKSIHNIFHYQSIASSVILVILSIHFDRLVMLSKKKSRRYALRCIIANSLIILTAHYSIPMTITSIFSMNILIGICSLIVMLPQLHLIYRQEGT